MKHWLKKISGTNKNLCLIDLRSQIKKKILEHASTGDAKTARARAAELLASAMLLRTPTAVLFGAHRLTPLRQSSLKSKTDGHHAE
jgi:hypothetical protein